MVGANFLGDHNPKAQTVSSTYTPPHSEINCLFLRNTDTSQSACCFSSTPQSECEHLPASFQNSVLRGLESSHPQLHQSKGSIRGPVFQSTAHHSPVSRRGSRLPLAFTDPSKAFNHFLDPETSFLSKVTSGLKGDLCREILCHPWIRLL